jgi:hypothetical protein
MNKTVDVADTIESWFDEYASVFEFDGRKEFKGLSLEDMKSVDVEQVWGRISPTLKQLVSDYVTAQIEELAE